MPTQPQQAKEHNPGGRGLSKLPHHLAPQLEVALRRRGVQLGALFGLLVVIAVLMGPSFRPSEALWQKLEVGTRAEANIKATRNFHYTPSEQELDQRREAAAAGVLPVFDHQVDLTATLLSRVNRAFQAMTEAGEGRAASPLRGDTPEGAAGAAEALAERQLPPAERRRRHFERILHTGVAEPTYVKLQEADFSPELRATVILLVDSALAELVVAHRDIIQPYKGDSITVRHVVGSQLSRRGEKVLSDLSRLRDLQQVREQIRHQATVHGARLTSGLRDAVVKLVTGLVVPNLVFNEYETSRRKAAARAGVVSIPEYYAKGRIIVRDGDEITERHLRVLREMEGSPGSISSFAVFVGIGLLALVILVSAHRFAARQYRRFVPRSRDLVTMGLLLLALLALTRGTLALSGSPLTDAGQLRIYPYLLPVAAGAMLIRLVVTAEAAGLFAVVVASLCGLMFDKSLELALFYLITGIIGAYGLRDVQSRSTVLRAGLSSGLVGAVMALGLSLFGGQLGPQILYAMLAAVAGGVLAAFAVLALLPAVEWLFAYTTDISLLELANLNHPLLRELMLRAPGTYHHSMVVGSLAEAACEGIGANGLLARVASNYHDVGKMKNAAYFAENFRSGDNPHNRLRPSMSGLIIRNHVKDGIEMMRQHGIPDLVIDTASQHHGTALIAFFYRKALEQKDTDEEVREEDYRYLGPKPQTREAGVLMLADGVEAAARSLAEPTVDRVRALVQRIINTQFTDGQLDQCDLTLRDLHVIARSFLQVLRGIYHARPSYPWQRQEESRRPEDGGRKERRKDKDTVPPPAVAARDKGERGRERGDRPRDKGDKPREKSERPRDKGDKPRDKSERPRRSDEPRTGEATAAKGATHAPSPRDDGGEERKPGRQRKGTPPARSSDEDETAETSSPDIRRLGLN